MDASTMVEYLLGTAAAPRIEARLFAPRETLHAPHLIDVEVANALRRYAQQGELEPQRGQEALSDLADFPLARYPHDMFLGRIWELRHNLSAYDAAYVAIAEVIDATLVTRDGPLAAAPGHRARIELI